MKHIKKFGRLDKYTFFKKITIFLSQIVRNDLGHSVSFIPGQCCSLINKNNYILLKIGYTIHFYNNQNQLKDYPLLKEYIESKIKLIDGTLFEIDFDNIPVDIEFNSDEYELFKDTNKYNL